MMSSSIFFPFEVGPQGSTSAAQPPKVFGMVIPRILYRSSAFEWLTEQEASRAAAMASPHKRAQFAAGRWLLHHAAVQAFGEGNYSVQAIEGRPVIAVDNGLPAAASLSHSANIVLCAAAHVQAIGIDVERIRPRADWKALSGLVLHPIERHRLEGVGESARWERFYQAWTFKEALAKALGVGFFAWPFDRIAISDDALLEGAPEDEALGADDWHLRRLSVGDGFAAALAWRA
jgi:phosphopantetheinyl transferase